MDGWSYLVCSSPTRIFSSSWAVENSSINCFCSWSWIFFSSRSLSSWSWCNLSSRCLKRRPVSCASMLCVCLTSFLSGLRCARVASPYCAHRSPRGSSPLVLAVQSNHADTDQYVFVWYSNHWLNLQSGDLLLVPTDRSCVTSKWESEENKLWSWWSPVLDRAEDEARLTLSRVRVPSLPYRWNGLDWSLFAVVLNVTTELSTISSDDRHSPRCDWCWTFCFSVSTAMTRSWSVRTVSRCVV